MSARRHIRYMVHTDRLTASLAQLSNGLLPGSPVGRSELLPTIEFVLCSSPVVSPQRSARELEGAHGGGQGGTVSQKSGERAGCETVRFSFPAIETKRSKVELTNPSFPESHQRRNRQLRRSSGRPSPAGWPRRSSRTRRYLPWRLERRRGQPQAQIIKLLLFPDFNAYRKFQLCCRYGQTHQRVQHSSG